MKRKCINMIRLLTLTTVICLVNACRQQPAEKITNYKGTMENDQNLSAVAAPTLYATIRDKKIAYRAIGSGQPFILCNRFRGTLDTWDPMFLDELAKNFRVIIFDYTGIGLSSGELPTKIAAVAEDVKDLAGFLELDNWIMGGWSYGGIVAQTFSTRYPERVKATVLMGTNPPGKNAHPAEAIFLTTAAKPVNDLEDEYILFFEPASVKSREAAKLSHDRIAQRQTDKDIPVPPEKFGLYFDGVADYALDSFNAREKLGKIATPVLSISGDHDCVCPIENWYPLTRKMSNLQIIMLPDAGHAPQHQYVTLVSRYINEFVRHAVSL